MLLYVSDLTMKPKKVSTPGSYHMGSKTTPPRKRVGRPGSAKKAKKPRQVKHRDGYNEQDMLEAMRLVREEGFSKLKAASHINSVKQNPVPRMTLSDRLGSNKPASKPSLGRPQEKIFLAQNFDIYGTVPYFYLNTNSHNMQGLNVKVL
jgi:hypothetical protein